MTGDRDGRVPATTRDGRGLQRLAGRGSVPWEAQLFARMAVFGVGLGVAYWFLTYETAGSVLLTTFGGASGITAVAIVVGWLRARRSGGQTDGGARAVGGSSKDNEPVPRPNATPLVLAVGLGLVLLGTVLGPWLLIAGLLVVVAAARSWLGAAMDETDEARGIVRSRGPD